MARSPLARDRRALYEIAVQNVEADVAFIERLGAQGAGRELRTLREDFCGTAALACHWVLQSPAHEAWGVDHDRAALAWAQRHHLTRMRHGAGQVALVHGDVRRTLTPRVDVVTAMNFSALAFHDRRALSAYFKAAWRALRPGGLFVLQTLGGPAAASAAVQRRRIAATQGPDGLEIPAFTYEWQQTPLAPGRVACALHFAWRDGTRKRDAFRYEWRLWSVEELAGLLGANGFTGIELWLHDAMAPHGRRKRRAPARGASWVGELVARRALIRRRTTAPRGRAPAPRRRAISP